MSPIPVALHYYYTIILGVSSITVELHYYTIILLCVYNPSDVTLLHLVYYIVECLQSQWENNEIPKID